MAANGAKPPIRPRFEVQSTALAAPSVARNEGRLGRVEFRSLADEPIVLHGNGNGTIELYHVDGLNHSDNMAIVYLPLAPPCARWIT
jgi:hypothetical protein